MKKFKSHLPATVLLIVITMGSLICSGCQKKTAEEKIESVDYTVCKESELPDNLVEIINEKKNEEFEITYTQDEYTYLVKGYGKQKSGGYNITVDDVYYTSSKICLATTLVGPAENELVLNAATYPYITVKVEALDKEGSFE